VSQASKAIPAAISISQMNVASKQFIPEGAQQNYPPNQNYTKTGQSSRIPPMSSARGSGQSERQSYFSQAGQAIPAATSVSQINVASNQFIPDGTQQNIQNYSQNQNLPNYSQNQNSTRMGNRTYACEVPREVVEYAYHIIY
jgi:hypothetical protein